MNGSTTPAFDLSPTRHPVSAVVLYDDPESVAVARVTYDTGESEYEVEFFDRFDVWDVSIAFAMIAPGCTYNGMGDNGVIRFAA